MTAHISSRTSHARVPGMIFNPDYLPALQSLGLDTPDAIYRFSGGTPVKQIPQRSIIRLDLPVDQNQVVPSPSLYLKRHTATTPTMGQWLSGMIRNTGFSPGVSEFKAICDFQDSGLPTPVPVAAGERRLFGFQYESFLITCGIEPFISLETLIRHHPERISEKIKKPLLTAIARLAKKMHDAGFNHLDFNADHVMVGPELEHGQIVLNLLDFQRIDRNQIMRFRWMIKTMAELFYSMPDPVFTDDDRVFMFEHYRGRPIHSKWDRFLLNWIMVKARRIGRHTEKIMAREKTGFRI
ncbi:lipopolysaccharide kinase InaA family protein [Desulfosarcina sp. OttesenSCG-928-B08]|nr:lipopolysaccharide kinase InaA family protein [Desulfosarcina sp. OttesenSCG-928-B08]